MTATSPLASSALRTASTDAELPSASGSRSLRSVAAVPTTMRAVVQDAYGSSDVLRVGEVEVPTIKAGEVLVRVHAAGLERGAWHMMAGNPYIMRLGTGFFAPRNKTIGLDLAGTVVAVGKDVTRFAVGDEVFGAAWSAFAEYTKAREKDLVLKPAELSFEQAAVLPTSACTALHALQKFGKVQAGQKVLVIGASCGVGAYAIQLAKAFDCEVTGVCSTAKVDFVRSMGADHVVDYKRDDVVELGVQYDLILEIGGGRSIRDLRRILTPGGSVVLVGNEEGGPWLGGVDRFLAAAFKALFIREHRIVTMYSEPTVADLEQLVGLVQQGKLVAPIDRSYPLAEARAAMRRMEEGKVRGKVALVVV